MTKTFAAKTVWKNFLFAFSVIAAILFLPNMMMRAAAQPQPSEALPPAAKAEFDQGLIATQQKQWDLAIRHFSAAQSKAPAYPPLLFNLGLAHSQAGNDIPGILWLHAYLSSARDAANAIVVRTEIERLKSNVRNKMSTIFTNARDAAGKLPRDYYGYDVARSQALAGDIEGAISGFCTDDVNHFQLWLAYAETLRDHGLVEAANAIIQKIEPSIGNLKRKKSFKPDSCNADWNADSDSGWSALAKWKLKYNDVSGARVAAQKINDQVTRDRALEEISSQLASAGIDNEFRQPKLDLARINQFALRDQFVFGYAVNEFIARNELDAAFKFIDQASNIVELKFDASDINEKVLNYERLAIAYRLNASSSGVENIKAKLASLVPSAIALGEKKATQTLPNLMLALSAVRDTSRARLVAQQLLKLDEIHFYSPRCWAVLGNIDRAIQEALAKKSSPFNPAGVAGDFADIVFIQAIGGDLEAAQRSIALAKGRLMGPKKRAQLESTGKPIPDTFGVDFAFLENSLARAYLMRGDIQKAIITLRQAVDGNTIPQGNFFGTVDTIVLVGLAKRDLRLALDALDIWGRVDTSPWNSDMVRLERIAVMVQSDAKLSAQFGAELYRKFYKRAQENAQLNRLTSLQKFAANYEATHSPLPAGAEYTEITAWLNAVDSGWATTLAVTDSKQAVKAALDDTADFIPGKVAGVAKKLGWALLEIRAMEERFGFEQANQK